MCGTVIEQPARKQRQPQESIFKIQQAYTVLVFDLQVFPDAVKPTSGTANELFSNSGMKITSCMSDFHSSKNLFKFTVLD